jgi:hypothetical protein
MVEAVEARVPWGCRVLTREGDMLDVASGSRKCDVKSRNAIIHEQFLTPMPPPTRAKTSTTDRPLHWPVPGRYPVGTRSVPGRYPRKRRTRIETFSPVPGRYPAGTRLVPGWYPVGVRAFLTHRRSEKHKSERQNNVWFSIYGFSPRPYLQRVFQTGLCEQPPSFRRSTAVG